MLKQGEKKVMSNKNFKMFVSIIHHSCSLWRAISKCLPGKKLGRTTPFQMNLLIYV